MHHRTLLGGLLLAVSHLATAAPTLIDFGPTGLTRDVRQVRLRFSEDMMALGDSAAQDAATVSCGQGRQKAAGHWIDGRNWVGEFEQPLPDGVACAVTPAALTSVKGEPLAAPAPWAFNTGGPRAELIDPRKNNTREEPVAIFKPSVAVDADSLRHLKCEVGTVDMPATILDGAARKAALEGWRTESLRAIDKDRWIVAQCGARPWPNGAHVSWTWGRQISANGLASPIDVTHQQEVRDAFGYDVKCSQQPNRAGCDPRGPLTLVFTEQVDSAIAGAITLRGSAGGDYAVKSSCVRAATCRDFAVQGALREGETVTPMFARPLRDVDGRLMAIEPAARRAVPIARLAAYVGIVQGNATLPWTPGAEARVAVATRNAESAIAVRSWRFGAAPRDIPALLALHRMAAAGFREVVRDDLPARPYAASAAALARAGAASPAMREQAVHPDGPAMEFVGLPLSGYGSWLVEADSARYRAVLAQRRKLAPQPDAPAWTRDQSGDGRLALVQLTNLQVSARLSPDHPSLLWVTAIDSGKPVGGAEVELWS
ncbi:MAG: hypothetical protein ABIT83_12170, partial [Massilia sp.]